MSKKDLLNRLVADLADLTGGATSKEQAIEKGLDKFLFIDHASVYGGYRLVNVNVLGGGHSGSVLGNATAERQAFKTFELMLRSCINGLTFKNN